MKNSRFDVLKTKKHSLSTSLDENSKKIQKLRIKIKDSSKLNNTMPTSSVQMDMKLVKVLVERTKFNVMLNLDQKAKHNNSPSSKSMPLSRLHLKNTPMKKLTNKDGPLASSTPQRHQNSPQKKSPSKIKPTPTAAAAKATKHQQQTIDGMFKIRKCCIKLPKDKILIELQQKQVPYPVELIVHKARGKPKKDVIDEDTLMVETPSTGQKRKSSEKPSSSSPSSSSSSPPKRKLKKGNEFFIKIGALTRVPSPRRKLDSSSSSSSPDDKPPQTSKERRKNSRMAPLRQKFGSRFFKSFVKIKRFSPNWEQQSTSSISPALPETEEPAAAASLPPPKKKNGKNLSVSFLETVEIFGESSSDEDWFDMDPKKLPPPPKQLDNLFDSLKTNTPTTACSGSSPSNSSGILKSSILDRKEKKSFSPLKETESPRKEQLKLANESFVRRSLETQIADDEQDIAEDWTSKWKAIPFRLENPERRYIFGSRLSWNAFQLPSSIQPHVCRCFCHIRRPFKDTGFKMFSMRK